jgi:hypothetical protein
MIMLKKLLNLLAIELMGYGGYGEIVLKYPKTDQAIFFDSIPNLVVDVGIAQAVKLLADNTTDHFRYGAVGTSSTAPGVGQTALGAEVDRQLATFSQETTTITNDTGKWVTTHTAPAGGWTLREYGLFTLNAAGIMFTRLTYGAITLDEANQLEFTYRNQGTRV